MRNSQPQPAQWQQRILYLRRDTSPDAVKALQERIDRFAAQAPTVGPDGEAARALLAHSRLLQDLLPAVDEDTEEPRRRAKQAAARRDPCTVLVRRSAVEATAQRFRLLLYLVSLLLLVTLGASRPAAACPRPCATTASSIRACHSRESTRLINCPPAETDVRLKQVLGELSRGDRRGTRLCGVG